MARTPEHVVEKMRKLLSRSGWDTYMGTWSHSDRNDEFATSAEERGRKEGVDEGRRQMAAEVIAALGLAGQYPDVTKEHEGVRIADYYHSPFYGSYMARPPESYTYTTVTPGTAAFMEDVATVAKSRDAEDARKRLGVTVKK